MAQYGFYQDEKCIIWERTRFTIDAPTQKEAMAKAAFMILNDIFFTEEENIPQYYENRMLKLPVSTDSTLDLTKHAVDMLRQLFRKGIAYKRAGVILSDLRSKSGIQADLFNTTDRNKHDQLMETIDALNDRFGRHRLMTAAEGFEPFKMNRSHLSQQYTTDWKQIIKVKS